MSDHQAPHILCVNHAPEILALFRDLLEDEGFRVSTLTTVERDLDEVVALAPDLITIDYMWTTSDNEWTFLTLLRMDPRTQHIPIILCTGAVVQAREMEQHLTTIGVRIVLKPFNIEAFVRAVYDELGLEPVTSEGDATRA
jgi:CheY-like chemotaxis protein